MKKILVILLNFTLVLSSLFAYSDSELQSMMTNNNTTLNKAREDAKLAHLDYLDAKAGFQPTVDLLVTGTYMVEPPIGKITIDTDDLASQITGISGLGGGPYTLYKGMDNTLFDVGLKITQPIFTWGKLSKAVSIYDKVELVRNLQVTSLHKQLVNELKGREVAIYYLSEMKKNLEEQKNFVTRLVEISEEAKDQGILLDSDVLDAKVKAQQVDMGIKQIEKELNSQLVEIWNLTGNESISVNDIEYVPDEEEVKTFMERNWDELLAKALSPMRDSINMLSVLEKVSSEAKEVSENSIYWKPDMAIQLDLGYSGSYLPIVSQDYYRQDKGRLNITLALKGTVWDGGKKLNDISRKTIKEESSTLDTLDAKKKISKTLNDNLLTINYELSKIEYEELSAEVAQLKVDKAQKELEQGYGDEKDVLLAKIDKYGSLLNSLEEKVKMYSSYYTVKYLIGE